MKSLRMVFKLKIFSINYYLLVLLLIINFVITESNLYEKINRKSESRTLTFLPTSPTRVQFIGGIGIPVEDLHYEAVTSGYVLKAEYFLPEVATHFTMPNLKPQSIHRRSAPQIMNGTLARRKATATAMARDGSSSFDSNLKSQHSNASTYRWILYKAIEVALSSSGLPGKTCMLRSICEHATAPLHYGSGILAELLHIILTPSTSQDKLSNITDSTYLEAEHFGRAGKNCKLIFRDCSKSPIDLITAVFDLDHFYY